MAKKIHRFDAEALARIGESMVDTYKEVQEGRQKGMSDDDIDAQVFGGMGQAQYDDAMESKYLPLFPRLLGERSPREYDTPSPMQAHFGGPREQLEYQQSQEFDASRSAIQSAQDEAETKRLNKIYKQQEKERKKQETLYKKQLKAQAKAEEQEAKAQAVRQFEERVRGSSPLALEDFDDMGQFQKARKMRHTYIEEMAGDYAGAPRDSPLQYHERRQADFMRMGDDYLDQPGGYLSLGAEFGGDPRGGQRRREYLDEAELEFSAIEDEREREQQQQYEKDAAEQGRWYDWEKKEAKRKEKEQQQKYKTDAAEQGKWYDWEKKQALEQKAKTPGPLNMEDFKDRAEYNKARKIRDRWMEEQAGDYAGAGADSYMVHHKRVQHGKKLDKTMMEAQRDYRQFKAARETKGDAMLKDKFKADFNSLKNQYSRLGTKIRQTVDPIERDELTQRRNQLIIDGKKAAENAGMDPDDMIGQFPYVDEVDDMERYVDIASQAFKGKDRASKVAGELFGQAGEGSFYERGSLFRGTSYASTGAINGVMKALAGIFILFVFIGVFYLVFGPIYDSLIHNFTLIVSVDGDPTLGGKDIPTLFDNVAKVVLVWVPLIVFAGALYKLTALVFEREVGTRTNEETEWDMLAAGEDSVDLDAGSDPSVFEAYGGGY